MDVDLLSVFGVIPWCLSVFLLLAVIISALICHWWMSRSLGWQKWWWKPSIWDAKKQSLHLWLLWNYESFFFVLFFLNLGCRAAEIICRLLTSMSKNCKINKPQSGHLTFTWSDLWHLPPRFHPQLRVKLVYNDRKKKTNPVICSLTGAANYKDEKRQRETKWDRQMEQVASQPVHRSMRLLL